MDLIDDGKWIFRATVGERTRRRRLAAVAMAFILALVVGSTAPVAHADGPPSCRDVMIATTALAPLAGDQQVYGRLCEPGGRPATVLQVLVHGGTYSHTYWDFAGFDGKYSYTDVMNRAGYGTLAIDLLGVGNSSHPSSVLLTAEAEARVVHDVVQAARSGRFGTAYGRVVTVGHSIGSVTSVLEAALYHDVDGVAASGFSHSPGPVGLARLAVYARPAQLDPVTRSQVPPLDLGYLSAPGSHAAVFYGAGDADPAVVEADEATRSPLAAGFLATFPTYLPLTSAITAPVLVADGQLDVMFCGQGGGGSLTDCATDDSLRVSEAPFFGQTPDLETFVLPGAGHILNLTRDAPAWYARALGWFESHFPAGA
ncbi:MAG TPA: alpha/beta fold hydrolase [Amycolatopsis sp.]|nr:alpha/beta fold hydrolase [Amycolatopsis sp.]